MSLTLKCFLSSLLSLGAELPAGPLASPGLWQKSSAVDIPPWSFLLWYTRPIPPAFTFILVGGALKKQFKRLQLWKSVWENDIKWTHSIVHQFEGWHGARCWGAPPHWPEAAPRCQLGDKSPDVSVNHALDVLIFSTRVCAHMLMYLKPLTAWFWALWK